jgi:hypothetical protein
VNKPANTARTGKRAIPKTAWKPGQSGNPKGRPKDGESWASVIKAVGEMYPGDILDFIGRTNELGKQVAKLPKNVQMKYLVTTRIFSALMFDPTSGLWKELMERADGKLPTPVAFTGDMKVENKVDDERFDRALSSLSDAIRESLSGTGDKPDGKVDTPK